LLASHHRLIGPRIDDGASIENQYVVESSHNDRQSIVLVRSDGPVVDPAWTIEPVSLEDLVLGYMGQGKRSGVSRAATPMGEE
jgi:ABC-2 type transport system ATP-binding protein